MSITTRNMLCLIFLLCNIAFAAEQQIVVPVIGLPALPKLKEAKNPLEAIIKGSPYLSFRPRYEHVHQDSILRPATALTLRSLLGIQTQSFAHFDAHAQFSNVSAADNSYDSTKNRQLKYSIIADPAYTQFTQAYIGFSGLPMTYIKVGRQLLSLDNQRFVGSVNFRQNLQNVNAVSGFNQYFDHLSLFGAYLTHVEPVITRGVLANDVLLNLKYDPWPYINLTTYAYLLDHHGEIFAPAESTHTYGVRFTGNVPIKDITFSYTGEYAHQQSAANNPVSYTAYFTDFELGASWRIWSLSLAQQLLSGEEIITSEHIKPQYRSFRTPLATKHLFQGWADMFLLIPFTGMIDRFATLTYAIPTSSFLLTNDVKISAIYHNFRAQSKPLSYGNEWDFDVTKIINKYFSASVTYADFISDLPHPTLYPTTRKIWLTLIANFSEA